MRQRREEEASWRIGWEVRADVRQGPEARALGESKARAKVAREGRA